MSKKETCPDCGREMRGGEDVLVGGELDREKNHINLVLSVLVNG